MLTNMIMKYTGHCQSTYRMAGNFRGVRIFVVDLAVMKINTYGDILCASG